MTLQEKLDLISAEAYWRGDRSARELYAELLCIAQIRSHKEAADFLELVLSRHANDGKESFPMTLSDIPCAPLMIGRVEFVSQSDGSILIVGDPRKRYTRVEEKQAADLLVWLSNHLRIEL